MSEPGWTLDTLKDHFDCIVEGLRDLRTADKEAVSTALNAAEKAVAAAMAASEKAILKAETAADKRAEASNEIRAAMIDQQKNFANKEQTELRLKMLEDALSSDKGKSMGIGMMSAIVSAVVFIAIAIAAIVVPLVLRGAS